MECVEAALKTSFRKEMGVKSSPQAFLEDVLVVNNGQNGVAGDDFSVDGLFDFTNGEGFLEQQEEEEEEDEWKEVPVSSSSCSNKRQFYDEATDFNYGCLSAGELAVPADDVASLEWLSHFVEDSFSEHSAAVYPTGTLTEKPKLPKPEPEPAVATCFKTPVPGKARSKRSRTGGRVWSLVGSPSQ
ncbi:GATA transcription factor 5 [Hibiscus trionum]|uniref:GATA transcription factor 5 n=1 Tax=Hibiscus trionum TaxID=183268 RepID=A0A9W7H160_HIBTR|nr:GATA transcription factor 5 [Hibiscus trionum]